MPNLSPYVFTNFIAKFTKLSAPLPNPADKSFLALFHNLLTSTLLNCSPAFIPNLAKCCSFSVRSILSIEVSFG